MKESEECEFSIKLLIIGDSSVGKTNFISKFVDDKFIINHMATTGMDFKTKIIEINENKVKVQIWDTAGEEKYRSITKSLFLKVQGILLFYDITNEDSFNNLNKWIRIIKDGCGTHTPVLIVGNKNDLEDIRKVDKNAALEYAKREMMDYIETSSKTGDNVQSSITIIARKILNNFQNSNQLSFTLDSTTEYQKKKKCCPK